MSTAATAATEQVQDEFSGFATGYDADAMENRMKHGGLVPVGKYNAVLIGAQKTESKNKNTPGWELVFKLTQGIYKDQEVRDTLYITDNSKSRDRLALFGHRLGLLKRQPDKSLVKVEGKVNLSDCLDTPCVIEVIHEPGDKDPNKKFTRIAFGGIWQPDHPDLKKSPPTNGVEDPKAAAAAAKATTTTTTTPPPADGTKKPKVSRGEL